MKKSATQPSAETTSAFHEAEAPELEFPDAPDFISQHRRRTLDEMLPLLEEFRRWPQFVQYSKSKPKERCFAEFVL